MFEDTVQGVSLDTLKDTLSKFKYQFGSEVILQDGIETALLRNGVYFKRERSISKKDRPDFMLPNGIAIEVKIAGTRSQFLRQASRYLENSNVDSLLLVGTPYWISTIPSEMHGKPLGSLRILASML